MIRIRHADQRGAADYGWLKTFHTFSFNDYYDPQQMNFRVLRVMNEDVVAPGQGFGAHPHRDMEIVTYVLSGALEHKDSMGNGEVLRPGEFQRMTAGSGITHSEFNPSSDEPVHLYQIWLLPERKGLEPSYEQKRFDDAGRLNQLQLVASPTGQHGSLKIHQNAKIYLSNLTNSNSVTVSLEEGRHAWLQVLRGIVQITSSKDSQPLSLNTSDGAGISDETALTVQAIDDAEIMLFDLP